MAFVKFVWDGATWDKIADSSVLYSLFQAKEVQFCVGGLPVVTSLFRLNPHLSILAFSQVRAGRFPTRAPSSAGSGGVPDSKVLDKLSFLSMRLLAREVVLVFDEV
jgi:hypothetical protein